MPRKYVRKTERGSWDAQKMNKAVAMVQKGIKLRSATDACQVPKTTLRRYLQKLLQKLTSSKHLGKLCLLGPEELELVNHITEFERKGFPPPTMDIRQLAYEFVVWNNIKHFFDNVTQTAEKDWWIRFKKRHQNILIICKPQALFIQMPIYLNNPIVEKYFQLLERVMEENNLFGKATRIYNVNETGLSPVPGVKKIVGKRGMKGSCQISGGERGQLQTVVMATNAAGDYVLPTAIYKGKRMLPEFENNFPPRTIVRLSESGYVNKDLFLERLEHFCKSVNRKRKHATSHQSLPPTT